MDGSGFGTSPGVLPAVENLGQFQFTDVTASNPCAGRTYCPVYLHYTSWKDSAIIVDGFGPQYGGTNGTVARIWRHVKVDGHAEQVLAAARAA